MSSFVPKTRLQGREIANLGYFSLTESGSIVVSHVAAVKSFEVTIFLIIYSLLSHILIFCPISMITFLRFFFSSFLFQIITFDGYGVSGHCNHCDVHHGVR